MTDNYAKINKLDEITGRMERAQTDFDTELAHATADDLLCEFLIFLGYKNLVDQFEKVPKWYA